MSVLIERRESTAEEWWRERLRLTGLSASTRGREQAIGRAAGRSESHERAPEGGTGRVEDFHAIEEAVAALAEIVPPEELEYGVETPLIPALFRLVRSHGEGVVLELAASIESNEMDPGLGAWILRWLGRLPDHATHHVRRWLLERCLQSTVPMIRDGAAMGLGSLGDPRTLPALRVAVGRERYARLRRTIERALRKVERVE